MGKTIVDGMWRISQQTCLNGFGTSSGSSIGRAVNFLAMKAIVRML